MWSRPRIIASKGGSSREVIASSLEVIVSSLEDIGCLIVASLADEYFRDFAVSSLLDVGLIVESLSGDCFIDFATFEGDPSSVFASSSS